jgi:hypothetical protein
MKKIILSLAIGTSLFFSCENTSKNESKEDSTKTEEVKNSAEALTITDADLENFVKAYNSQSDTSKVRFVDSLNCNSEKIVALYDKGILTYSINKIEKLTADFNKDGADDFIITYTGNNCWRGNGADNYLSNYIFATTNNGKLELNKELTDAFRTEFEKYITTNYGKGEYDYKGKPQFMNGIAFKSIKGEVASGTIEINTPKCQSAQPCISGSFEFNMTSKKLEFKDVKNTEK